MYDLIAINSRLLITKTRDWKAMEYFKKKKYKLNIKEFDEEKSLKLLTYSCGHEENLPNELVEVGKKIIKACNGLLLSLKVIDAFLRKKKRLRC
uniref:Pp1 protein n=1 Tax=Physcomitrium patens TaxID=3218 RepID=Q8LPC0_PHYPA|nr:Pp1 [Physcomitrium patens]